jgi:PEP-CTERM motif
MATIPPVPPDPGRDWLVAVATSGVYPTVAIRLGGPFGSAFADDSLPASLDLADFPDFAIAQGLVAAGISPNPSIEDVGTLTSLRLVPEPGALALVAIGLAALARRAR